MIFRECIKQLNDYSKRFRQHDNINFLETLLTNAFVKSTPPSTIIEIETTQNDRQLKCLNFLNNNSKLISDQVEVLSETIKIQLPFLDPGSAHQVCDRIGIKTGFTHH